DGVSAVDGGRAFGGRARGRRRFAPAAARPRRRPRRLRPLRRLGQHARRADRGRRRHPALPTALMRRADLPNAITGLRLAMAPVLPWLLWAGHYRAALVLALIAGVSDGVDGWLARRYGWRSRLGSLLDPVADKAMLGLAVFGLW